MKHIDNRVGYRTSDVRVFKSKFDSTPAPYVKSDMGLLIDLFYQLKKELHPVVSAIIFHHKFEKIHPFMDGNGRTGRMIMNILLSEMKYPLMVIPMKKRIDYINYLSQADKSNIVEIKKAHYSNLVNFIVSEGIKKYWDIFL